MTPTRDPDSGASAPGDAPPTQNGLIAELDREQQALRDLGFEGSPAPHNARVTPKRALTSRSGVGDNVFRVASHGGGVLVLTMMVLVGLFLLLRGFEAIDAAGWSFITTQDWEPNSGRFGIAAMLFGTVSIALIAISVALPLAIGVATYISEYAPEAIRRLLVNIVDLMAAIPSVVYGLWGFYWLQEQIIPVQQWMSTHLSWIPFLAVPQFDPDDPTATVSLFTAGAFLAGLVVAMMVTPIAASIMREVFSQAPAGEREGALALGATKWGMIRTVVYPFGLGGIIGGTMLGLGRALGETVAVYLVISPIFVINWHVLSTGTNSISSLIALRHGEASDFEVSALMAAGLVLFLITMAVNFIAGMIVNRSRSGASS
ncbi:phosphate ABC transporter permease subunit PstC [Microbacterium album]|uniref:Phosphate transport system permease protein n=1 Tax=Microbacterium album TaxID=2053191 RepID=A0A917MQG9_9MICO|nr:phosphate ABC transporter permease subunit PstC [Microbacterium album]GGH51138.1 phosphate transport system permease protein [Microbacterium album]